MRKSLCTLIVMIMTMVLSLPMNAQAPFAKKVTAKKAEKITNLHTVRQTLKDAKDAKVLRAAQAEKAAAPQETATSVLRRSAKNTAGMQIGTTSAKVLPGVKFNPTRTVELNTVGTMANRAKVAHAEKFVSIKGMSKGMPFMGNVAVKANPFKVLSNSESKFMAAPAQRVVSQEGDVTVTTDAHGIITDVAGVEAKAYKRSGYAFVKNGDNLVVIQQSGVVSIVESNNGTVFVKDPVSQAALGAWVKGTKEGNKITIPAKQPLAYSSNYDATVSIQNLTITKKSLAYADDLARDFVFTVDGNTISMDDSEPFNTATGTSYIMAVLWDDDNSIYEYGDNATVWTYDEDYVAPSTDLVELPAGAEVEAWVMNCVSDYEGELTGVDVNVAFVENDVYVQGVCTDFPESWVKGTLEGGVITFEKDQYLGSYYGVYDIWFMAYDGTLCDAVAVYDADAKTITFDENMFVLENTTVDAVQPLDYFKDIVLSAPSQGGDEPGEEGDVKVTTDENGIITSVTGGTPKYYQRSNEGTAYFASSGQKYYDAQSGTVTTIEDGDDVYIKDPISRYTQGSWVKGVKADGKITIAAKQPLYYSSNYETTVSLRWGVVTAEGNINAADANADVFTFTIDGDKLILEGTESFITAEGDAYFMGAFWDDDNSATDYGDAETVLTLDEEYVAPVAEPVVVPEEAEVAEWYMNATDNSGRAVKNRVVKVAADEMDVYVQGLSAEFPEAWVKGTYDEATDIVTFPKNQWLGYAADYGRDIWFLGFDTTLGDICDVTAVYDFENSTITFNEMVVINGATDRMYYLEYYDDVVLSMEAKAFEEPVITDLTATLPYLNTFETEAEQEEVAIYDANDDGSTFGVLQETEDNFGARYSYNSNNTGDDYLVFPGLELKAGKTYKVTVDARSISPYYVERFEVVAGKEAKASQLITSVIPATEVASTEYATFENISFTVEEDGTYYFAVHAISEPDQYRLWVDNFSVKELDNAAPVAVEDLTVIADPSGANKATITFTVPSQTLDGTQLKGNCKAIVERDGKEILSSLCTANSKIEFEDEVSKPGFYKYSVTISQLEHVSEAASVKAYIGEDTPDAVKNLKAADNGNGTVGLTWAAPTTGVNNGIIIPENLKYNVYPVEMIDFFGWQFPETDFDHPYLTGLTETNATVPFETNEGEQGYSYLAVTAENEAGESEDLFATFLTGAPYELPFVETLPGNLTYFWSGDTDDDNYDLEGGISAMPTTEDEEGDLAFFFDAQTAGWMELYSGKIALSGKAELSFDYKSDATVTLKLYVSAPGKEDELVETVNVGAFEENTVKISLADYIAEPWVRLTWRAEFDDMASLYIDNISIMGADDELAAKAISAPAKVEPNADFNVNVTLANLGANVAEGYTVELYKNGAKVAEQEGAEIASGAKTVVKFVQTLGVAETEAEYKAVIVYDLDSDETNNETETVKVTVKQPNYPVVTDLTAAQDGNDVKLTWSEPDLDNIVPEAITEDFEGAEPFAQTVDGWTFVDGDGGPAGGIQGVDIPGQNAGTDPLSWFVFDTDISESYAGLSHSGNKHMSTMFNYPVGNVTPANDDWMISPELYGGAQTISFWATELTDAYGPEKMEVLYSTTDKEVSSFTSLGVVDVDVEWHEFTYDLPEGAKYFAIRYVSQDVFMLWVDDVTFIPANASADLALVGYNIYRDGVKLNAEPVAETSYVDANAADDAHTYVVTVVYDKGESAPSNAATTQSATAINSIDATNNSSVKAYTIDGRQVNPAQANGILIIEKNGKRSKVVK